MNCKNCGLPIEQDNDGIYGYIHTCGYYGCDLAGVSGDYALLRQFSACFAEYCPITEFNRLIDDYYR